MGKGDKKTRRGKIILGSHGVRRRKRRRGLQTVIPAVGESSNMMQKAEEITEAQPKAKKTATRKKTATASESKVKPVKKKEGAAKKKTAPRQPHEKTAEEDK
ncbi:MAG: 30S ribosomal protein THX [Bacteroidales bacterium]|nr:30S ribosomal protein THX [Bacteroidales bacterium]